MGGLFALTLRNGPHSISPESSDGFASVGTILPNEEAALLPGGLFAFLRGILGWVLRDAVGDGRMSGQADVAQLVEQLIRNQ